MTIILVIGSLAVGYVWQNIEVMKLRMEYDRLRREEVRLMQKANALRFEIERYRRPGAIEKWASAHGWKRATPRELEVLVIKKDDK